MRILAISLLRLGDILLQGPLLAALQKKYPKAEIDLLINDQFLHVQGILPNVHRWIGFPRQKIQKNLVEEKGLPKAAFAEVQTIIQEINSRNYDLVLNLTHNYLSARLMDLIHSDQKRGLRFENGQKVRSQNRWEIYLNEHFSETRGSRFHYTEVLASALGLQLSSNVASENRFSKLVLIQAFTADEKKNWGVSQFKNLKEVLEKNCSEFEFLMICSPQERSALLNHFSDEEIVSPNLEDAKILLSKARLLITGDTSIQHLAAQEGCEILSLFLGSSDPQKTHPWSNRYQLIQSEVSCYPCKASSPCSQATHLCAETVSVAQVAERVFLMLEGRVSYQKLMNRIEHFEDLVWRAYLDSKDSHFEVENFDLEMASKYIDAAQRFHEDILRMINHQVDIQDIERKHFYFKDSLLIYQRYQGSDQELRLLIEKRKIFIEKIQKKMENIHERRESSSFDRAEVEA